MIRLLWFSFPFLRSLLTLAGKFWFGGYSRKCCTYLCTITPKYHTYAVGKPSKFISWPLSGVLREGAARVTVTTGTLHHQQWFVWSAGGPLQSLRRVEIHWYTWITEKFFRAAELSDQCWHFMLWPCNVTFHSCTNLKMQGRYFFFKTIYPKPVYYNFWRNYFILRRVKSNDKINVQYILWNV